MFKSCPDFGVTIRHLKLQWSKRNIIMSGFIFRCSRSWYRCNKPKQTFKLSPVISSVMGRTCILSKPVNNSLLVPYRTLYYLENENIKEYKRFPSLLDVTEDIIKDVCFDKNPTSPEEWDDAKMEILNRCLILREDNFDSVLMQVLLQAEELLLAHSFMDYLKKMRLKPNFVTLCKYMVLCSKKMDQVEQNIILETYEKIISLVDTSVLDARMVEFLVQGLCVTDRWQESLTYINQLPKSHLTTETLNALACAALRNKAYGLAWNIITKWYRSSASPATTVFVEYMKFVISLHKKDPVQAYECFISLANYVQNRNIILKEKAVVYIEEYFKRMNDYKTSYSKVDRDGICSSCKRKLEACSLTREEFMILRDSFLKYSLQKSDIFINTTGSEFEKYCKYVDKYKPFDIVLDGLNVAHADQEDKSRKNLAMQLFHVVNHLSKYVRRILVLGRYHMKEWPLPIMRAVRSKSSIFYVSNITQDDPYLIYAALASGPKTLLVSDDMMRDHMSRLPDPQSLHLFKKWQQSHQVYLQKGENENEILLMGPLKHAITIQGNMGKGWHVPFDNEMKREPYEELNNWLCVQKYS